MDTACKKKRTPNFSELEIGILLELVGVHAHIIENKKTDGCSLKEKQDTWLKLAGQFNITPGVSTRSPSNLKTCYENLKRRLRKDIAEEKVEVYKTGGGGASKITKNKIHDPRLMELMGSSIRPLRNAFDSDAAYQGDMGMVIDVPVINGTEDTSAPFTLIGDHQWEPTASTSTAPDPVLDAAPALEPVVDAAPALEPVVDASPSPATATPATPATRFDLPRWHRRRMPPKPKPIPEQMSGVYKKRVELLEKQMNFMQTEHRKEIRIKNLKILMLKQKLKYWKKKNSKEST